MPPAEADRGRAREIPPIEARVWVPVPFAGPVVRAAFGAAVGNELGRCPGRTPVNGVNAFLKLKSLRSWPTGLADAHEPCLAGLDVPRVGRDML